MNSRSTVLGLALLSTMLGAAAAQAGTLTAGGAGVRVNGATVAVDRPVTLDKGDIVETHAATATWTSASGDVVVVEEGSTVEAMGESDGVDALFLQRGAATGDVSAGTALGAASGWAAPQPGGATGARVFIETSRGRHAVEAHYRAMSGSLLIQVAEYRVDVPANHAVTLTIDPDEPGTLGFRTRQTNAGDVVVARTTRWGPIVGRVPRATIGEFRDGPVRRVTVEVSERSHPSGEVRLETHYAEQEPQTADVSVRGRADIKAHTGKIDIRLRKRSEGPLARDIRLGSDLRTLTR